MATTPRRAATYIPGSGRQQSTCPFYDDEDNVRTPERNRADNSSTSVFASPLKAITSPFYQAIWNAQHSVVKDFRTFFGNVQATFSPNTSANRVRKQTPMTTERTKTRLLQQKAQKQLQQQQQRKHDNEQQEGAEGHARDNDASRSSRMTTRINDTIAQSTMSPISRATSDNRSSLTPLIERHSLREDTRPKFSYYASSARNPFYQESLTSTTPMSTPSLVVDNRDSMMITDTPRSSRLRSSSTLGSVGDITPVSSLSRQFNRQKIDTSNSVLSPERPNHLSTPTPTRNMMTRHTYSSHALSDAMKNSARENTHMSTTALKKRLDEEKERLERLETRMIKLRRQSQILAGHGRDSFFLDEGDEEDGEALVAATAAATPSTREYIINSLNRPHYSLPIRTQQQSQKRFKHDTTNSQQKQLNEALNTPPRSVDYVSKYRPTPASPSVRRTPFTTTTDREKHNQLDYFTPDSDNRIRTPRKPSTANRQPLLSEMSSAKLRSAETIHTPGGSRISNRFWKEIHGQTEKRESTSPLRLNERASFWTKRASTLSQTQGSDGETGSKGLRTPMSKHSWSDTNVLTYDGDMDETNTNSFNAKLFEIARQERKKLKHKVTGHDNDYQQAAAAASALKPDGSYYHNSSPVRPSSSLTKRWFLEDEEDEVKDDLKKQPQSKGKERSSLGTNYASSAFPDTRAHYTPNRPSPMIHSTPQQQQQMNAQIPKKRPRIESNPVGGIDGTDLFNNPMFRAAQENMKAYETVSTGTNTAVQTTFRSGVLLTASNNTPNNGAHMSSNSKVGQYHDSNESPTTPARANQTPPQYSTSHTNMTTLSDELDMAKKRDEEIRKRNNIPTINPAMLAELKAKHRDRLIDDFDSYKFT